MFWTPPATVRSRALTREVFWVFDGSEGVSTVDHGLMARVIQHPKFGKRVDWTPPPKKAWAWSEGTQPMSSTPMLDIRRAIR